jgi:hypothetical protein
MTAEITSDPTQPSRLEKKKNTITCPALRRPAAALTTFAPLFPRHEPPF